MGKGRDIQYMKTGFSISVIDHFFDKLIHIGLPKEITNPFMRNLYQKKQQEMIDFVVKHAKKGYVDY